MEDLLVGDIGLNYISQPSTTHTSNRKLSNKLSKAQRIKLRKAKRSQKRRGFADTSVNKSSSRIESEATPSNADANTNPFALRIKLKPSDGEAGEPEPSGADSQEANVNPAPTDGADESETVEDEADIRTETELNNTILESIVGGSVVTPDVVPKAVPRTPKAVPRVPKAIVPPTNTAVTTTTTINNTSTAPKSRRQHEDADSVSARALYMATHHARPAEMDRRANAQTSIKDSVSSTHLFDNSNTTSTADDNNNTTKSGSDCPFERLNRLHPSVIAALINPRGRFKLQQLTHVQTRAIHTLLPPLTTTVPVPTPTASPTKEFACPRNTMIQSETGSGKTLAYLLPILAHLTSTTTSSTTSRTESGTQVLILTPTRELALQIHDNARDLCQSTLLYRQSQLIPGVLVGGENRSSEKARIRKGLGILIATPGRLLDHFVKTEVLLERLRNKLKWLVLDEADRLLDAGAKEGGMRKQVESIVSYCTSVNKVVRTNSRSSKGSNGGNGGTLSAWRNVLVSATVTKEMEALSTRILMNDAKPTKVNKWVWIRPEPNSTNSPANSKTPAPNDVTNTPNDVTNSTPRQLAQQYLMVSAKLRLATLVAFLVARMRLNERVVVFLSTCVSVDYHTKLFQSMNSILGGSNNEEQGFGLFGSDTLIEHLHGNIPQSERCKILHKFADSKASDTTQNQRQRGAILFCTDVAARGLNLRGIHYILQYDPPSEISEYVHRIGRAARAGEAGRALLFLLPSEKGFLDVLETKVGSGEGNVSALSWSETLKIASGICEDVTREGLRLAGTGYQGGREGGGQGNGGLSRRGEAFVLAIQARLEDCVITDDLETRRKSAAAKQAQQQLEKQQSKKDTKTKKKKPKPSTEEGGILLTLARQSYFSHLRAYPTREKALKLFFSPRALHLGHVAKSFALRDPPKTLAHAHWNKKQKMEFREGKKKKKRKFEEEEEDYEVLKSTGKKRNASLVFENQKTGNGSQSRNWGGESLGDTKRKRTATGTFTSKPVSQKQTKDDKMTPGDAKIKMMAAARRMQNGSDYF